MKERREDDQLIIGIKLLQLQQLTTFYRKQN